MSASTQESNHGLSKYRLRTNHSKLGVLGTVVNLDLVDGIVGELFEGL